MHSTSGEGGTRFYFKFWSFYIYFKEFKYLNKTPPIKKKPTRSSSPEVERNTELRMYKKCLILESLDRKMSKNRDIIHLKMKN